MSAIGTPRLPTQPAVAGQIPAMKSPALVQGAPRLDAPGARRFGDIRRLFTVGPNPIDKIRPGSTPSIAELLTVQRAFSEYALKVELCTKSADAVTGVVRRLQQGG